jgi:hypothetical protein
LLKINKPDDRGNCRVSPRYLLSCFPTTGVFDKCASNGNVHKDQVKNVMLFSTLVYLANICTRIHLTNICSVVLTTRVPNGTDGRHIQVTCLLVNINEPWERNNKPRLDK